MFEPCLPSSLGEAALSGTKLGPFSKRSQFSKRMAMTLAQRVLETSLDGPLRKGLSF